MSGIKVIRGAEEYWYETRWNTVVEYKGEKYVISVEETPKWGDRGLYHYDETQKYSIGDAVCDDDLQEQILGRLEDAWGLSMGEFNEGDYLPADGEDYEEPKIVIPEFSGPKHIPEFDHVPKESQE